MTHRPKASMPAMADYGVQASTWDPLPWTWAAERLAGSRNFWVGTVNALGMPHSMPVWGVWDDEWLRFMFSCSPNAAKARNIAANPQVVVTVDDTVEAVSVQGRALLLTPSTRREEWVDRYVAKYGDEVGEGLADFVSSHAMFEVTPIVAFGMVERTPDFNTRATRWHFPLW